MTKLATFVKPVVLCGGSGTRLWPLSTPERPKQFLNLVGDTSMLSETLARVGASRRADLGFKTPSVVGNLAQADLLREAAGDAHFLLEPVARNSAPAIAAAAIHAHSDDLLLVMPADHHIRDLDAFHDAIANGVSAAKAGYLVTFGLRPTHPATGYGYIRAGEELGTARRVDAFVEKPDRATAERYLAEGAYAWNAGIFLFRARDMIAALQALCPTVIRAAAIAVSQGTRKGDTLTLKASAFAMAPDISIDNAVMEKTSTAAVVNVDMGWSDIGDFQALLSVLPKDEGGTASHGDVIALDTENCLLKAEHGTIAAIGVDNIVVVKSGDTVLVTSLDRVQDVKKAAGLAAQCRKAQSAEMRVTTAAAPSLVEPADAPVGPETLARVKNWLFDQALPFWAETGLDRDHGGFRERLTLRGAPKLDDDYRRLRVQARQIYTYAHAHLLGWQGPALERMWQGYDFLTQKGWKEEGGWLHLFTPEGGVKDATLDLYDQAFVMMAMAWAHRASGDKEPLEWAARTLDIIDRDLYDPMHGGYRDNDAQTGLRRSNPHMHLLEAMLALHEATGDTAYLVRAKRVVTLFERRFFDPETDTLTEYFDGSWQRVSDRKGRIVEPGHHYEWAWLLWRYQKATGHDLRSHIARLIGFADRHGRSPYTGFAMDGVWTDGSVESASCRLWPQTEMLKARLAAPDLAAPGELDHLVSRLLDTYLAPTPAGTWMDQICERGTPIATTIPASTLYHVILAFAQLLESDQTSIAAASGQPASALTFVPDLVSNDNLARKATAA